MTEAELRAEIAKLDRAIKDCDRLLAQIERESIEMRRWMDRVAPWAVVFGLAVFWLLAGVIVFIRA